MKLFCARMDEGDYRSSRSHTRAKERSDSYWRDLSASPPRLSDEHFAREKEVEKLNKSAFSRMHEQARKDVQAALGGFKDVQLTISSGDCFVFEFTPKEDIAEAAATKNKNKKGKPVKIDYQNQLDVIVPKNSEVEIKLFEDENMILAAYHEYSSSSAQTPTYWTPKHEHKHMATTVGKKQLREAVEDKITKTSSSYVKVTWNKTSRGIDDWFVAWIEEDEYESLLNKPQGRGRRK